MGDSTTKEYKLNCEEELRLEVGWDESASLKVTKGTAEIFGTELALNKKYVFTGCKLAIFTWHGCTITIEGSLQQCYVANETPMVAYISLHEDLERMRNIAAQQHLQQPNAPAPHGPRVLIAGPTDSGKSSLSKILLNYGARLGRKATFVDLDVGQGQITIPGTIAAIPISEPVDVEEGFALISPLVYFFGHVTPGDNPDLYKMFVERIIDWLNMRADPQMRSSGLVINTCGWVEQLGYRLLLHAIEAMQVNIVVVMGDDRLHSNLRESLKGRPDIVIQKLPKSGGVVARDGTFRRRSRMLKIREYFYGPQKTLCPHSCVLKFDDVVICKVGSGVKAPQSALPIGHKSSVDPTQITEMKPNLDLMHNVLGVSHATVKEDILKTNVAGIVYVTNVDLENRELTVLAPSPGPFPSKFLITATLKWMDQN